MNWYLETKENLYKLFNTSEKGLSNSQVTQYQKQYGLNQIASRKDPFWKILIEPFRNIFVAVLMTAAIVSLLSHEELDAVIIGIIILINSTIYYTQYYATQRVLRSLKKHSETPVTAIRNGKEIEISSTELVPGDIIQLSEGDRIPADARIIHEDSLQIDESSLTGESVPVRKFASTLQTMKKIFEQENMVFQSTYVLTGSAQALVVATGQQTEFGKIAQLASNVDSKSPVQEKIDQLITLLVKVIFVVVLFVFTLSLLRNIPASEALRFVLSLSVSAVPEGLPVALTVIIVLGMRRMAKQKALVRTFKAIEDVGLITTIATDKTGTLTKNHLAVIDHWSFEQPSEALLNIQKTISRKQSQNDPLDKAIAESIKHTSIEPSKIFPFDIKLRMSGAYYDNENTLYIKGSPEHIISACNLHQTKRHEVESMLHTMAAKGFRVIAVAVKKDAHVQSDNLKDYLQDLDFKGLVAFADELRPDSKSAVKAAREAGINVKLITGDHYETAFNIAKTVGIASHQEDVISGEELTSKPELLSDKIRNHTVFARILPEDKYQILQSLKETEITAMTGDGVNDVPALTSAHVGFAMGSGNDIAKDAGDIVLLNNKFSTIIAAISEGRKIYDNIRRMLFYLLSTTLGEAMTMIGALIVGLPLPVTAIQILWINLITDTALVLPLGLEPNEDQHMKRPPRRPKDPLLSNVLLSRMVIVASAMAISTLIAVYVLSEQGYSLTEIQTVTFMMLIAAQWTNAFNARSENNSSFSRLKRLNKGMFVGLGIAMSLQAIVMFGPLASVFKIQPVAIKTLGLWVLIIVLTVLCSAEIHKAILRKYKNK